MTIVSSPATEPQTSPSDAGPAMAAAKPPVGTGSSPLFAQLIGLALVALGVVGVQALLASLGAVDGRMWVAVVVDRADGIDAGSAAVLVVGIVAAVLGLLLLPVAVKRRPRKGLALTARTGVHLRPRDVERVATYALESVDSVTDMSLRARGRRLHVTATTIAPKSQNPALVEDIRARVDGALSALERAPRTTIAIRNEGR